MAVCFIKYNMLRILPENLNKTIEFYEKICGMKYCAESIENKQLPYTSEDKKLHVFNYQKNDVGDYEPTGVCFMLDRNHQGSYPKSGYWKVGLGLRDVNAAVDHFRGKGFNVDPGAQFVDVGYLTAMSDPNGYSIELLQHDFEGNFSKPATSDGLLSQPRDVPPSVGQITIRCTNAKRTCQFYQNVLCMKLLCTEIPGNKFPFTLYFFAYTDDEPLSANLSDVVNREWLYKKRYCQIEVQHRHNLPPDFAYSTNDENGGGVRLGHVGFCIHVTSDVMERVKNVQGVRIFKDEKGKDVCFVHDPDGYVIQVELAEQPLETSAQEDQNQSTKYCCCIDK